MARRCLGSVALLVAGACAPSEVQPAVTPTPAAPTPQALDDRVEVRFAGGSLVAEVADEPAEWSTGLMHRTELGSDAGMLFLFDDERSGAFWMKDTLVGLSIAYLRSVDDDRFEVVDIRDMAPCPPDAAVYPDCPTYPPAAPYVAALEANLGWFASAGVEIGTSLEVVPTRT